MNKEKFAARSMLNQAIVLVKTGRFVEARGLAEQACDFDRRNIDALFLLGAICGRLGDHESAIKCNRRVLKISPRHVQATYNLAIGLRDAERFNEAVKAFRKVLKLSPHYPSAWSSMAHALISLERYDEAEQAFRKALKDNPNDPDFYAGLGSCLQTMGRYEAAVNSYRKALKLHPPDSEEIYNNLGNAFCFQGKIEASLDAYREVLKIKPEDPRFYSNLLLTLQYLPEISRSVLLEKHLAWPGNRIKALEKKCLGSRDLSPDRRLRLGYVSSDFRSHSVAFFMEPVLGAHDHDKFEISCFFSGEHSDATTDKLRLMVDTWFDIKGKTDEECIELILSNKIDLLVDLNGHTARNRLTLFAKKPAPVQVTYLGYPGTTGLSAIDYRLIDELSDPPGSDEYSSERLIRLPGSFLCYKPPAKAPSVSSLPAIENGYITFGSFNNLAKVNEKNVELWSRILHKNPEAHLLIKSQSLNDVATKIRYVGLFENYGVSPDRLEIVGFKKSQEDHLSVYNRVDIALDSFPYNGTTTTCESLWMGVPVVTLAGDRHSSRVGLSLLESLGRRCWVANDEDDYIATATDLACDIQGLDKIRRKLRTDMKCSRLCDASDFTRGLENVFRHMWCNYVEGVTRKIV